MRLTIKKARRALLKFASGHYNLLLILLFLLFVFRPYENTNAYIGIWKVFQTTALMMAIFTIHHSQIVKITVSILAIPAVAFTWISLFDSSEYLVSAVCVSNALFMTVCTGSILQDVLRRSDVTVETLKGVICAYFLIAFVFAYLYLLVEAIHPGSVLILGHTFNIFEKPHYYFSVMLYYSFMTLLAVGYGDIVAAQDISQTLAVVEGIFGQFYIAILVARLVAVYTFSSSSRLFQELDKKKNGNN
jgi:voltage-gated potassium channel